MVGRINLDMVGNAAGAAAVTVMGAWPSTATREQVQALVDSQEAECTLL